MVPIAIFFRKKIFSINKRKIIKIVEYKNRKKIINIDIVTEELERINTQESNQVLELVRKDIIKNKKIIIDLLSKSDNKANRLTLMLILGFYEIKEQRKFKLSKRKGHLLIFLNKIVLAAIIVMLIILYLDLSGTISNIIAVINDLESHSIFTNFCFTR